MYLPVVKRETISSLGQSLIEKEDDNYTSGFISLLKKENPILSEVLDNYIGDLSEQGHDPKTLGETITICGIMYNLLRSQAEADFMNKE